MIGLIFWCVLIGYFCGLEERGEPSLPSREPEKFEL
jgi:hypothetical protein